MLSIQEKRRTLNTTFALSQLHLHPTAEQVVNESIAIKTRQRLLWQVRECDNKHKEIAWRLQTNSVRAAGGHDIVPGPCPCGWEPPPLPSPLPRGTLHTDSTRAAREQSLQSRALSCKAHVFGDCPVAQAVIDLLRDSLPPLEAASLQPAHLWLLRLPESTQPFLEGAWSLICSFALHAMSRGHAYLYLLAKQGLTRDDSTRLAADRAKAWVWHLLSDFASVGRVPAAWREGASAAVIPFFSYQPPKTAGPNTVPSKARLVVQVPAMLSAT